VHLGTFGCVTKLGGKRAELVQKFVQRNRVGIFRNDCTRSSPLDPKLMFWCISYYLDAFGTVWLSCKTRCKTGRTSAKVCAMKSRSNFAQERIRATPLYPKLIFWPVLFYLGAFGIVWLAYKTRCKTGWTSEKVGNTKSRLNFSQRTHPIHPHWTLNSCFGVFRTIWVHLGSFSCLMKLGAKRAELVQKFVTQSCVGIFRNERTYSTPLDPKLIFWRILYYSVYLGQLFALWSSVQNGPN